MTIRTGLCLALVLAAPSTASATSTTFTGADPVDATAWHDPDNWDNGVPGKDDRAVIPSARLAVLKTMPAVVSTVQVTGVPPGVPNPGKLIVEGTGVSLTITGETPDGGVDAIGSAVDGELRVRDGAAVHLGGRASYGANADLIVETATLTNSGRLEVPTGRGITTFGASSVLNTGTIAVTSGTGTFSVGMLDNDGRVEVDSGTFFHNGPGVGTSSGRFALADQAVLSFNAPFTIDGAGSGIEGGAGEVQTTNSDARVRIGREAIFDPRSVRLLGGRMTVAADGEIEDLRISNSTYEGTGDLTLTGTLESGPTSGLMMGEGSTTVLGSVDLGASATIGGGHTLTLPSASATTLSASITLAGGATVANPGRLELPGAASVHSGTGGGLVRNTGTIARVAGGGAASIQPPLHNSGTIVVQTGTLDAAGQLLQTAGLTDIHAGATLSGTVSLQGGILRGDGSVAGDVLNSGGLLRPGASPGTLAIAGNYAQGPGGTLEIEIEGTTPGSGHDRIEVGGTAELDGTLAILSLPGFTPDRDDRLDVVTSNGSLSGAFAALTGEQTPDGVYETSYTHQAPGKATLALTPPQPLPPGPGQPAVTGTVAVGETVTCETGTWTGADTFAFQWLLDDAPIPGATSRTYAIRSSDATRRLSCRVTGSNAGASTEATSAPVTVPAVAEPMTPPAPEPTPMPAPAPTPAPAPAPTPTQPAPTPQEVALASAPASRVAAAFGLPSPRRCVSRRRFPIRIKRPRGVTVKTARVTFNRKALRVRRRAGGFATVVDLRGLPKASFTIAIRVRTASGKTIRGHRRYRTCIGKRRSLNRGPL